MSINPIDTQVIFLSQAIKGSEIQNERNMPFESLAASTEKSKETALLEQEKVTESKETKEKKIEEEQEEKEKGEGKRDKRKRSKEEEEIEEQKIHELRMSVDPTKGKFIDITK